MFFQTVTTRFEEFKQTARKKVKCEKCGKTFSRQRTFTETMNPWNKNEHGEIKTSTEIYKSLRKTADEWLLLPEKHGCDKK